MTWTKLGDEFSDETAGLSDAAVRTHVNGLNWTMKRETGGRVTERDVRRFADSPDFEAGVKELVALGYWTAEDGGYQIRHHMEHQPEPDLIAKRRALTAERQRRHRRKQAGLPEDSSRDITRDAVRYEMRYPGRVGSGRDGLTRATTGELGTDVKSERATAEAEHRAQIESADAWFGSPYLEYAQAPGGRSDKYHQATCRLIDQAVRAADRGESRYPLRLSMEEINARNLKPCGVCHGYEPLERKQV